MYLSEVIKFKNLFTELLTVSLLISYRDPQVKSIKKIAS